jgi:hypothetical protein
MFINGVFITSFIMVFDGSLGLGITIGLIGSLGIYGFIGSLGIYGFIGSLGIYGFIGSLGLGIITIGLDGSLGIYGLGITIGKSRLGTRSGLIG